MALIRVVAEIELPADPREHAQATLRALDLIDPFLAAIAALGGEGAHKTVRERVKKVVPANPAAPVAAVAPVRAA